MAITLDRLGQICWECKSCSHWAGEWHTNTLSRSNILDIPHFDQLGQLLYQIFLQFQTILQLCTSAAFLWGFCVLLMYRHWSVKAVWRLALSATADQCSSLDPSLDGEYVIVYNLQWLYGTYWARKATHRMVCSVSSAKNRTTVRCVPLTTMVKRALSRFRPTARESILAPAEVILLSDLAAGRPKRQNHLLWGICSLASPFHAHFNPMYLETIQREAIWMC